MTAKVRPARGNKGFEYDIRFIWPEGGRFRERANAPVSSKSGAMRWAEARERALLAAGKASHEQSKAPAAVSAVPTFGDLWPRVLRDHYRANRKKASTIDAAESIYRTHLAGPLAEKHLDAIATSDVAALKGALAGKEPKTVNNVLSILSRALHCAVDWEVLAAMPCKIGLLRVADGTRDWYERDEYRRLVDAATKCGPDVHLLVLLGGSAGLRRGEIRALKWTDLDLKRKHIELARAIWRTTEDTPKGGRGRVVPMTPELADALTAYRHLKGDRVIYSEKGRDLSNRTIRNWLARAQRRAGLVANGAIHILRHTFCSHLAAAGAPAKAIQELAGHADLATTQRYMHLSPSNRSTAMATLAAYHAGSDDEEAAARSA